MTIRGWLLAYLAAARMLLTISNDWLKTFLTVETAPLDAESFGDVDLCEYLRQVACGDASYKTGGDSDASEYSPLAISSLAFGGDLHDMAEAVAVSLLQLVAPCKRSLCRLLGVAVDLETARYKLHQRHA